MSCRCHDCGRWFADENEWRMHRQVHLPAAYECFKCTNRYRKYSDMICHLEYGCGGIDAEDLNKSAAMVYQWKHIMDPDYRVEILRMDAEYGRNWNHEGQPRKCPNCGNYFKKLSALFQHAWSRYGAEAEDEGVLGKLKRWLWNRHG
ncbi:hypothetical protein M409DRAFT_30653 [Zasmidium cellare ATCC 36951]|uniref:C2H2-type domain-containing protein n=1 Tax=Zasmidium cellare ATCC 36951 TaxID=1080233 RepID=A0A6A6BVY0_ZASCE|nr:uncharacterized protein M409DRAFT_30653 [Zasmidium cellare ATCC 36951]KAF2158865.1 hypothetical protein M409DRAFT_30653 [Zasmidium cellare ATCC 36951]